MLGHAVSEALPGLRRQAESRMGAGNGGSTADIKRLARLAQQNEDTGATTEWQTTQADVIGRLGGARESVGTRTVEVAGADVQVATRTWHAPADSAPSWRDGDVIHVTAGSSAGRFYRVVESSPADQQTAHRMPVVEVARPADWG